MNLDWIILHGLRVLTTCPLLDFWMPRITALGNSGIVWVVAAIVLLCTKKYRRYGVMLLVGLAAALLLSNLALKNLFARPRPCWLDESVPLLIARPSDYSFPSGHTMAGAIGATILTAADRRFGWAAIRWRCSSRSPACICTCIFPVMSWAVRYWAWGSAC